jgi:hypothetical protein
MPRPALSVARRQVNHTRVDRPLEAVFAASVMSRGPGTFSVTGVPALAGLAGDLSGTRARGHPGVIMPTVWP